MYMYMSIRKVCCILWRLQRHPLRLRNSHIWAGIFGDLGQEVSARRRHGVLGPTGPCQEHTQLSTILFLPWAITKVMWLNPNRERQRSLSRDQASVLVILLPTYKAETLPIPDALYPFLPLSCSSALLCQILNESLLNPSLRARGLGLHMWIHSGSHHSLNKFTEYSQNPMHFSFYNLCPTSMHICTFIMRHKRRRQWSGTYVSNCEGRGEQLSCRVGYGRGTDPHNLKK